MAFNYKDKDQLVNDVIESLKVTLPDNVDYSDGEPLRTIIEALMQELDLQYWQMEQVYDSAYIESAVGEDLDKLVKILGVTRELGSKSAGNVTFSRTTPASEDYLIDAGTLLSTLPNADGEVFQYETAESAMLLTGEIQIIVPISSIDVGIKYNITANTITVINTPPTGIEFVNNNQGTNGGFDIEEDDLLRARAEKALEASGLGTVEALDYHLSNISLIDKVKVYDMLRGIGTVDIIVLGESIPMTAEKFQECVDVADKTRAAGIDVLLYEPEVVFINVNTILTMEGKFQVSKFRDEVVAVIDDYVNGLNIGEPLIKNQLERKILNVSERIDDVVISSILNNIIINFNQVIRTQSITVG